jgi:hypothetical protein
MMHTIFRRNAHRAFWFQKFVIRSYRSGSRGLGGKPTPLDAVRLLAFIFDEQLSLEAAALPIEKRQNGELPEQLLRVPGALG